MSSSSVELIKEKLSIFDVVSSYIKLEKAGKSFKAKSPFSSEKTPSFYVVPDKGFFHCFSTGKGGDIFNFVQEMEGVDFYSSLKILADRAGVTLDKKNIQEQNKKDKLYEILDLATKFYEINFRKEKEAVNYLLERGMKKESMISFRIGYAPAGWDNLYLFLKKKGYGEKLIEEAGLIKKGNSNKYYDHFRERIMFPIFDNQGRVVAFSGRIFLKDNSKTDISKTGKYVNSPEGLLYNKSKILFGYDRAKRVISEKDSCVIVEGQMDLIMTHQVESSNTVCLSGTALTEDQVSLIKRFTDNIIFSLDSDEAGIKAVARSIEIAFRNDMSVKVISLPKGEDPASIIVKKAKQWNLYINDAKEYLDFRLESFDSENTTIKEKEQFIKKEIFPFLIAFSSSIQRDIGIKKISSFLGVREEAVQEDFVKFLDLYEEYNEASSKVGMIENFSNGEGLEIPIFADDTNFFETPSRGKVSSQKEILLGIFLWQDSLSEEYENKIDKDIFSQLKEKFEKSSKEKIDNLIENSEEMKKDILIFKIEEKYLDKDKKTLIKEIEELTIRLEEKNITESIDKLKMNIHNIEKDGDEKELQDLLKESHSLSIRLEDVKKRLL